MTFVIETRDLSKYFGDCAALSSLNLQVAPGCVFGLIGPNGSGKTTTLRLLLDIIRPTSGSVTILGEDPRRGGPALRRRIGFIPGELRIDSRATGQQFLDFYADVSNRVPEGRINELAERVGANLHRPVRDLSKGNKQKLGIVQAFMHTPELLILDEPTSGLDPLVKREFLQMVTEARDNGQTVLLSSHILSEIQQTADYVAVLSAGRLVAQGDVSSLRLGSIRHIHAGLRDVTIDDATERFAAVPHVSDLKVAPSGVGVIRLVATVDGDIDPFLKALATFEVADVTIEEPDLEESVLRLYGPDQEAQS